MAVSGEFRPYVEEEDGMGDGGDLCKVRCEDCKFRTYHCCFNFRFAVTFLLICIAALTALVISGSLLLDGEQFPENESPFTFDDVFTVRALAASVTWMPDGHSYSTVTEDDEIVVVDLNMGTNTTLMNATDVTLSGGPFSTYSISPSQRYVLLGRNLVKKWRNSYFANYVIYDTLTQSVTNLGTPIVGSLTKTTSSEEFVFPMDRRNDLLRRDVYFDFERQKLDTETVLEPRLKADLSSMECENRFASETQESALLLHPQWAQDSDTEWLAYVQENDVYIADVSNITNPIRVTNIGSDLILCGTQSWLYEEEIFSSFSATWWSPTAAHLAYFISDETLVTVMEIPLYSEDLSYPTNMKFPYPKVGFPNPTVSLYVFDLSTKLSQEVMLAADFAEFYITGVWWGYNETLVVRTADRLQQTEILRFYNLYQDTNTLVWKRTSDGKWIDTTFNLQMIYSQDLSKMCFVDLQPQATGARNFNIISYSLNLQTFDVTSQWITNETADVTEIEGYNANQSSLYYTVALTPIDRSLSFVSFACSPSPSPSPPQRLYEGPRYYSSSFSPTADFYLLADLGDGSFTSVPTYTILSASSSEFIAEEVQDNAALEAFVMNSSLASREYFQIPSADGKDVLNAMVTFPPGFPRRRGKGSYDYVLRVYGGPGSQTVSRRYALGYDLYLASSLEIVVVSVDVRGTGLRGAEFEQQTYLSLGELEAADVIAAVKYLKGTKPYRARRVCVWGWSYGGFLSSKTLQRDTEGVVDCGLSVAPVTDWRYYDTAYTERYMQTPMDNPAGYNVTSLLWNITTFAKKAPAQNNGKISVTPNYMLIHGTADDNVHYQQSAVFSRVLVRNGVPFRFMAYTNDAHSINLPGSSRHIYATITNFFTEMFGSNRYSEYY